MGKTRLLREFLQKVRASRRIRRRGHVPIPGWAEVGYFAVRQAIVALAGLPNDGGAAKDWTAAGAEARAASSTSSSIRTAASSPSDELRFAVAEALRWAIVRASERAKGDTVVVAVDDLHAIDGASRTAFADAVGEPPLVPSVLVVDLPARPRSGLARQHRIGPRAHGPRARPRLAAPRRNEPSELVDRRPRHRSSLRRSAPPLLARAGRARPHAPRRPHRAPRRAPPARRAPRAPGRSPSTATTPTRSSCRRSSPWGRTSPRRPTCSSPPA